MIADDGTPVTAAKFVPAIEQLGLARELDRHVLDLAIHELEAHPAITLSINVSGLTVAQAEWSEHVRQVLGAHPDAARRLIFEITETAAIVDIDETHRFTEALIELGARSALDDFGAGFTSIRYLRALPLAIMKIDKDLLHGLLVHADQQHLVRMLIELARGLGIKTVAEGVENAEVAAWLRGAKVDMMQGYFFGKPVLERPWQSGKETVAETIAAERKLVLAPAAAL